jgi:transcriptional regulator with XRE-family HTH domain
MNFQKNLNEAIEAAGITQTQLARRMERLTGKIYQPSRITNYTRYNRWPNLHTAYLLAKALGIPLSELVK